MQDDVCNIAISNVVSIEAKTSAIDPWSRKIVAHIVAKLTPTSNRISLSLGAVHALRSLSRKVIGD